MTFQAANLLDYFTFLVLIDILIPISLYVSMELVKFQQARFINDDLQMYDEASKTFAKARTSALNEELGQVNFILSDKTGTLTRNMMEFLRCSINGVAYGPGEMAAKVEDGEPSVTGVPVPPGSNLPERDPKSRFEDLRILHDLLDPLRPEHAENVDEFLTCLAVCHTIIAEFPDCHEVHNHGRDCNSDVEYQAASPDEKALALMAKDHQYYFYNRSAVMLTLKNGERIDAQTISVNIRGDHLVFEIYEFLEFDSTRKRMSVIVKDPRDGKIKLYCKGADNVLYPRCIQTDSMDETEFHLMRFSNEGLRTLVCAYREIQEDVFLAWFAEHQRAKMDLVAKSARIAASCELIE
eukprot:348597_1